MSDKPKRKHIPPPEKPPTKPFDPSQQVWPEIEPSTECLIGKISVAWAKLEASLHDLIWELTGLSLEDGRAITGKQDAVHLIAMLNVLENRHIPDNLLMPDGSKFLHKFFDVLDYIETQEKGTQLYLARLLGAIRRNTHSQFLKRKKPERKRVRGRDLPSSEAKRHCPQHRPVQTICRQNS
jgi:hypothetical protein